MTFIKSKIFLAVILGLIGIGLLLLTFSAGMSVGFRKAAFTYAWDNNYRSNFGGLRSDLLPRVEGRNLVDAHGISGQIISIRGSEMVVKGPNAENIVTLNKDTEIRSALNVVNPDTLQLNDWVVVIGSPDDSGRIVAKLVRVMTPPAPGMMLLRP